MNRPEIIEILLTSMISARDQQEALLYSLVSVEDRAVVIDQIAKLDESIGELLDSYDTEMEG